MNSTPTGQPEDDRRDDLIPEADPASELADASSAVGEQPVMSRRAADDPDRLEGPIAEATGPAPGETVGSAIDGASRPDRVAIGMMVGVVVLLLICVAFGFAAR